MMASKTKAQLLAEARKAGIKGLSEKSTVTQIRWALGAAKDVKKAKQPAKTKAPKAKQPTPEQEQAQMVAEREERRAVRRAEQAQAAAARIENEAAAKALIRSATQQAADRAKAGT